MKLFAALFVSALAISSSFAYDPSPLQDFCVATEDMYKGVLVNGKFCKNPKDVKTEDFVFEGLNTPGDTNNKLGINLTVVGLQQMPGLNTLGISTARVDYAPGGVNPPHTHPRGTELFMVTKGKLWSAFVTSDDTGNKLISKVLKPGDLMVYPIGLMHFQMNVGRTKAVAYATFNSQNPGLITMANTMFGSNPRIDPDVWTKALQVDKKVVDKLMAQFRS